MAAITFFLATSSTQKRRGLDELISFTRDLLDAGHVRLPAAIFTGEASNSNEQHGENDRLAANEGRLSDASYRIIPNDPFSMLRLTQELADAPEAERSARGVWYVGQDEPAFLAALHQVRLREHDICVCFPALSPALSPALAQDCGWDEGAAIYLLRRPFPLDFPDVLLPRQTLPLIDYQVADFFTLTSSVSGRFPDTATNPLRPMLQRYFGPDLDMKQTVDLLGW
jgi:hypothetical protein